MVDSALMLMDLAGVFSLVATAYWVSLILGGGLLLISCLSGGDADADVGADFGGDISVDADVGTDIDVDTDMSTDLDGGHGGATSLANWFSMQFVVFFMAICGVIGVTLTHLTGVGPRPTLGIAAIGGLFAGQGAHQVIRKLRRSSGNSTPQLTDYINKLGRVTMDVAHKGKGEVAVRVGRAERFVPAVSKREDAKFQRGDEVAVVDYSGGIATVVSREEFEFLTSQD
jgi:membrane protein implicated in regulation of membrane protease activity